MRRRGIGRDLALSVRMAVALALLAALYLGALALAFAIAVDAVVDHAWGAVLGLVFFAVFFAVLAFVHVTKSKGLALRTTRAHPLAGDAEPVLRAVVERVAAAADLPPPRIALIDSRAPNAFMVGLTSQTAIIAVTTELLGRLDEGELEAVVAHELAHVANRDGLVMTIVSGPAMLGSALWNADDRRCRILYLYYVPVHVVGLLLLWTISRYREYVADRGAALITGAPEQLMSALQKIAGEPASGDLRGGGAVSALCIVPAGRAGRLKFLGRIEIFRDHPPLAKRLRELEELARELGRPVR